MRRPDCRICENTAADKLISNFVFATQIVQHIYFLNFKALDSHLLRLYTWFQSDQVENHGDRFSHDEAVF